MNAINLTDLEFLLQCFQLLTSRNDKKKWKLYQL